MGVELIKIKSFTIVDVLAGMVITSIIIGMVFYLFIVINQQIINYSKSRTELNEFSLTNTDLKRQFFNRKNEISAIHNGIRISGENGTIDYKKDNDFLVRISPLSIDTLSNHVGELELITSENYFNGESKKINGITLKIEVLGTVFNCIYNRKLDNATKVNEILIHEF